MSTLKLSNILDSISSSLKDGDIPYALIGALALSLYGLPRYTADVDILVQGCFRSRIISLMKKMGYDCFQETNSFAQFDSELGILGSIDFMFVNTKDGIEILNQGTLVKDRLLGDHKVIQPTDYIVLKLMAIANNPDRTGQDVADIGTLLKADRNRLIPEWFEPIKMEKIHHFAKRFRQSSRIKEILETITLDGHSNNTIETL